MNNTLYPWTCPGAAHQTTGEGEVAKGDGAKETTKEGWPKEQET